MVIARKYVLVKHFEGFPKATDIEIVEEELPPLEEGEFLTEAVFLSVDPYLRAYEPLIEEGCGFLGAQVARIIESKSSSFPVGRYVFGHFGWRTHTISDGIDSDIVKGISFTQLLPKMEHFPVSLALGALGMPGVSAYFGFLEVCQPKPGETVVVSGACGAVGSHVGQIAKIKGCKVIGITGDDEKGQWLTKELGFDHFVNYKKNAVAQTIALYAPEGVDCYFDNVGGELSSIILQQMRHFGRIAVCGALAGYNFQVDDMPKVTMIQEAIIEKQLKMEGFLIDRWEKRWSEAIQQNLKWITEGKIKYRETITEGFENMFQAFTALLNGEHTGKAIVKV